MSGPENVDIIAKPESPYVWDGLDDFRKHLEQTIADCQVHMAEQFGYHIEPPLAEPKSEPSFEGVPSLTPKQVHELYMWELNGLCIAARLLCAPYLSEAHSFTDPAWIEEHRSKP